MPLKFLLTEFMKILDRLFPAQGPVQGILTNLICVFFFLYFLAFLIPIGQFQYIIF